MLSNKIKELRCEKGLSQQELADKLNVVRQTVSKWEKGLSLPDSDMLINIASVLDTSVSKLLDQDEPNEKKTSPEISAPAKNKLSKTTIILLIIGSPIWLALGIAAIAVALSLYISLWAVIVSLWAVFGALVGAALGGVAAGILLICNGKPLTGIALLGMSFICAGLSVFAFLGCKAVTKATLYITKKFILQIKDRFNKKEGAQ